MHLCYTALRFPMKSPSAIAFHAGSHNPHTPFCTCTIPSRSQLLFLLFPLIQGQHRKILICSWLSGVDTPFETQKRFVHKNVIVMFDTYLTVSTNVSSPTIQYYNNFNYFWSKWLHWHGLLTELTDSTVQWWFFL